MATPGTPRPFRSRSTRRWSRIKDLLDIFFTIHDPTTLNRQGADMGTQYRSAIFYRSPEQKATAEQTIAALNAAKIWGDPIVTELAPAPTLLCGRGLPPGIFREQRRAALLPRRRRAESGQIPQALLRQAEEVISFASGFFALQGEKTTEQGVKFVPQIRWQLSFLLQDCHVHALDIPARLSYNPVTPGTA